MGVWDLIADMGEEAREVLGGTTDVGVAKTFPPHEAIRSRATWLRIDDVVALVVDLKGSTRLGFRRFPSTSARTYDAVIGCGIEIVEQFEPQFIDIQGDGFFALFHGELSCERAYCCGLTLRTFSEEEFLPAIQQTMPEGYPVETGLKAGIASSTLLVKRVGTASANDPIWAGKAVNYAAKCAQAADAHELIVTGEVYDALRGNDFIEYSCRCVSLAAKITGVAPHSIWEQRQVRTLGEAGRRCRVRQRPWCETCGDDFCHAILNGKRDRADAPGWMLRT